MDQEHNTSSEVSEPRESEEDGVAQEKTLPGVVELLEQTWKVYKERFQILIGVFLLPAALTVVLSLFTGDPEAGGSSFLIFPGSILLIIVQIIAMIALLHVVTSKDEMMTVQDAYRKGLEGFFSYLWVAFLVGVITTVGFLLLIIPGIIFSVWFSFAFLVFVAEGKRGFDALTVSREYVKGNWWAVFGRFAFLLLISVGVLFALGVVTVLSGVVPGLDAVVGEIGGVLFSLFFTPFSIVYMYFIYTALKEIKGGEEEQVV